MNNVIVFRDFINQKILCGDIVSFKIGEIFPTTVYDKKEYVCFPDKRLITKVWSQNYVDYFARNDDGKGLLRGNLTYLLNSKSYTEEQQQILRQQWGKYLLPYTDVILFNNRLYEAHIETLQDIISSLKIEV